MGPKKLCAKNGPTRFSPLQISCFPTMVTLVWGGGEAVLGEPPPPPPLVVNHSKDALGLPFPCGIPSGATHKRLTHDSVTPNTTVIWAFTAPCPRHY